MHYLELSVVCSIVAATIGRVVLRRLETAFGAAAIGLLAAAIAAAAHGAAGGQFAGAEGLVIPFGLATGLALAAGVYLTLRALEDQSLVAPPSLLRIAMTVPLALGLAAFGSADSATPLSAVGMLLGAAGLFVAAVGARREKTADPTSSRIGATVITLAAFGLAFSGLAYYDAAVMSRSAGSVFLAIAFGSAGAALLAASIAQKRPFAAKSALLGAVVGVFLSAAYWLLLSSLGDAPSWRVFGFAAFAHSVAAALLAVALFRERYGVVGYFGLIGAAAGAVLVYLS